MIDTTLLLHHDPCAHCGRGRMDPAQRFATAVVTYGLLLPVAVFATLIVLAWTVPNPPGALVATTALVGLLVGAAAATAFIRWVDHGRLALHPPACPHPIAGLEPVHDTLGELVAYLCTGCGAGPLPTAPLAPTARART